MADFFFFTDVDAIEDKQTKEQDFGDISLNPDIDKYNLENRFTVIEEVPDFAVTKSLVFFLSDKNSSDLADIALLPINNKTPASFPINMFIYRGIKKSSLIDKALNLQLPNGSWKRDNILLITEDVQDKINIDSNTNNIVNSNTLGLQFDNIDPITPIEKVFFDSSDNFHPLIVPSGCQIGKNDEYTSENKMIIHLKEELWEKISNEAET